MRKSNSLIHLLCEAQCENVKKYFWILCKKKLVFFSMKPWMNSYLNLGLHILNGIGGLNFKGDRFPRQSLHKNLHFRSLFIFDWPDFSIAFTLGGLLNCMSFLEENRHFLKAPFLLKTLFLTAAGIRFLSGKCMATNLTSNFTSWSKIKKFLQISHDESGFGESTVISKTWFGKSALTDETGSSYALLMWC